MRMKRDYGRIFSAYLLFLCGILVTGCGGGTDGDNVIASVGDFKITVDVFNERISDLPPRYQRLARERKGQFLQELIADILLYKAAIDKGLDKDTEVRKMIEEAKKKILIARLLKDDVNEAVRVDEGEIEDFYFKNPGFYMTPEIMRASHVLVMNREDAEHVLAELDRGVPFEEVARAKSVDPTAQNGGDIGYFPRGQLMPNFEDACAGLELGQVSGIVRTKLGYHVIRLTDRKDPVLRPLEQVADNIRARLISGKRRKAFGSLLERLREEARIEINEDALSIDPETRDR